MKTLTMFHRTERIHREKKSSLSFPFGGGGSNPTSLPFIHTIFFYYSHFHFQLGIESNTNLNKVSDLFNFFLPNLILFSFILRYATCPYLIYFVGYNNHAFNCTRQLINKPKYMYFFILH